MNRLLILLTLLFIGCSVTTITSNCDESADFSSYKTFSYQAYEESSKPVHPEYNNLANREIIQQAITNELLSMGYKPVAGNPDLLVAFDMIITEKVDPRVDSAVIYKPWVDTKIDTFSYTEGLLVVRLIDREKGNMVWQGSLSGILNRRPEKFGHKINHYIAKLFATLAEHMQ